MTVLGIPQRGDAIVARTDTDGKPIPGSFIQARRGRCSAYIDVTAEDDQEQHHVDQSLQRYEDVRRDPQKDTHHQQNNPERDPEVEASVTQLIATQKNRNGNPMTLIR